ncbi:MAG: single-stranded DNA-binding protein [Bryobacteraceae bacterium]
MYINNRASLIGFLGRDAEVRYTGNQVPFTVLSLATKRSWKDRESGGYKSETTWHRCIAFGHTGDYAAKLTKGAHVQIEGEIRSREYTPGGGKNGDAKKSVTEIRIRAIAKLDRSRNGEIVEEPGAAA